MNSYDQIKRQLQSFEMDVDKEKLWANTAHAIPRKRRRNGVFFLLLAGLVLIGAGLFVFSLEQSGTSLSQHVESVPSTDEDIQPNASEINLNQNNSEAKENIASLSLQSASGVENESMPPLSTAGFHSSTTEKRSNVNDVAFVKMNESTHDFDEELTSGSGKQLGSLVASDSGNQVAIIAASDSDSQFATTATSEILMKQDGVESMTSFSPDVMEAASHDLVVQQSVHVMKIEQLPIRQLNQALPDADLLPSAGNTIIASKRRHPVDLYMTQSFGFSSLSVHAGSDELKQKEEVLNQNIKSLENLSTRIGALVHLSDKWIIGGGLQWNQLTTQTDFSWVQRERITGEGISSVVIDTDGAQHFQTGAVGKYRQTQWQAYRYSTHTTMNFEAQLAYQLVHHYRLDILAGVHGTYNLFYEAQGSAFDGNDQPIRYTPGDQPYKLTSPFNFGFSLTGSYQLNRHLGLQLRLQTDRLNYQEYVNQIPITYKHNIFSLGIGLRYVL